MVRRAALALVALCTLLAGCLQDGLANDALNDGPSGAEREPSPAWSFTDTVGEVHDRDRHLGAPVVLFLVATWCSSCKAEAPRVKEAHDALGGERVTFLSVGFDPTESEADLRAWKDRFGHPWPHGLDANRTVQEAFDVRVQSTVLVLDATGRLAFREYSPAPERIVEAVRAAR